LPRPVDRRTQQKGAKAPPDKFRDEPEIAQFALLRRRRVQLEIAGRYTADIEDKDLGCRLVDLGGERVVAKQPALVPQPRRPDGFVEITIERDGAVLGAER